MLEAMLDRWGGPGKVKTKNFGKKYFGKGQEITLEAPRG